MAAATLLQQRCLPLVRRRRHLLGLRAKVASWAPWLADLEVVLAAGLGQTLLAAPPAAEGAGVSKEQLLQVRRAEVGSTTCTRLIHHHARLHQF